MFMPKKCLVIIPLVLLIQCSLFGQNPFSVFVGAQKVTTNSYFEVSFTLEGEGVNFTPPSFQPLKILSGPTRTMSTKILDGKITRTQTYSFSIQTTQPGKFTIGRASIELEGKTLYTDPVTVEVIKGRSRQSISEDQQVFVVAIPSSEEIYVGQQLILDYKLFTTESVESYNIIQESDYPGFFAADVRRYDPRTVRQVMNGVTYATKILKRVALFPQQAGPLIINPLEIQLGVVLDGPNKNRGYFSGRKLKRLNVFTDTLSIQVNLLPESPPKTFTGAVGYFEVSTSINRDTLTTDDAISIKMVIRGNGDIKRVQPPSIPFPAEFELYNPKLIEESTFEEDGFIIAQKEFEYLAVPKATGSISIQPKFTFFDIATNRYTTIGSNIFNLHIRPGTNKQLPVINTESPENIAIDLDIRDLKPITTVYQSKNDFMGSSLYWILIGLPFILFFGVWGYRQLMNQRNSIDPEIAKRKKAKKVAESRLKLAQKYMREKESRSFYDEISKAMLGYVSDKLKISKSSLTKQNVKDQLQLLKVAE